MKRVIVIFAAFAACFSLGGCTEPIEFDTREAKPMLVVFGEIDDRVGVQSVTLSRSTSSLKGEPPHYFDDAEVFITSSDGRPYPMVPSETDKGVYITRHVLMAEEGLSYTLHVRVDLYGDGQLHEFEITTAPVLPAVQFERLEARFSSVMGMGVYNLLLYGNEPVGTNFYCYKLMIGDKILTPNIINYYTMDDERLDGRYLDAHQLSMHPSGAEADKIRDNPDLSAQQKEELLEQLDKWGLMQPGDHVQLVWSNIDEGFYKFINQLKSERGGSNPIFGGPPSNIISNVPGGVGYFTAYRTSTVSTLVPEQE